MQGHTETCRAGFSPWLTFPRWTIPPLWESSWVFNEISGPSVRRPTPSSSSSTDKASQPAHCPYTSPWGSLLLRCMHRACTCRTNSSLVYGCAMVKENTMFLAALIICSRLKSPTTAMLMGIDGRNGPPELFSLFLPCFYPLLYIFFLQESI